MRTKKFIFVVTIALLFACTTNSIIVKKPEDLSNKRLLFIKVDDSLVGEDNTLLLYGDDPESILRIIGLTQSLSLKKSGILIFEANLKNIHLDLVKLAPDVHHFYSGKTVSSMTTENVMYIKKSIRDVTIKPKIGEITFIGNLTIEPAHKSKSATIN